MWLPRTCCAVCLTAIALSAKPQDAGVQTAVGIAIEAAGNADETEAALDLLHETLQEYAQHPLNLNAATEDELLALPLFNSFLAYSLRQYIKDYGELKSPYELQYIHGFTPDLMQRLLPFVCVMPVQKPAPASLKTMLTQGRHEILLREKHIAETQQGYLPASDSLLSARPNARYAGGRAAFYGRWRYRYRDRLQLNLTADKDAGEEFLAGSNRQGFDFYSAHLQINNLGIVRQIVAGDFYAQFGQGLTLWQGLTMGKTPDAMSAARHGAGIKPYGGADENNFFRGAAILAKMGHLTLNGFVSFNRKDANANDSTGVFSTQYTSGLHNTAKTIHDKNALAEFAAGGNASYSFQKTRWGATALWHRYGSPLHSDPKPYQVFDLHRSSNFNISTDLHCYLGRVHLFGEAGISQNLAPAVIAGAAADIGAALQASIVYRRYAPDYQAAYGGAFAEGSKTANENGVYFVANVLPHPKLKTSFYVDVFSFPWLKYRAHAPSRGLDALAQVDYAASAACRMYLRARRTDREENLPNDLYPLKTTDNIEKTTLRYNIWGQLADGLTAQWRIEGAFYRAGRAAGERGVFAFQDLKYSLENPRIGLSARVAFFDTDGYNTRFYAYEDDVLYAFSFPACYGNGSRWYFNVHYAPLDFLDIWLRLSQTHYFDRSQTGSDLTLIDAPHRTEFKVQVRIKI